MSLRKMLVILAVAAVLFGGYFVSMIAPIGGMIVVVGPFVILGIYGLASS